VGNACQLLVRDWQTNLSSPAALTKSGEVLSPPVDAMAYRSAKVGDGGAHHETGVVETKRGLAGREEAVIEIS